MAPNRATHHIYSKGISEPVIMFPLIILCIWEERQVSKSGVSGRLEIQDFLGASPIGLSPGLYPEPTGGSKLPLDP